MEKNERGNLDTNYNFFYQFTCFTVLCWTIYRDKFHLGKMRISMFWGKVLNQQGFSGEEGLSLTATNIGKEPIVINCFGGKINDGSLALVNMAEAIILPKKLDVGETCNIYLKYTPVFQRWLELKEFYVCDTFGRKFAASKKDLDRVKKSISKKLSLQNN